MSQHHASALSATSATSTTSPTPFPPLPSSASSMPISLRHSLGTKIIGILLMFFAAALASIGLTLAMSWQLKGSSAAINDAGSLRMKTFQIGYLLTAAAADPRPPRAHPDDTLQQLTALVARFDATLDDLRSGDPSRPLFIPRSDGIPEHVARLTDAWRTGFRPALDQLARRPGEAQLVAVTESVAATIPDFVADIDQLVRQMEKSYARSTNILQASQVSLLLLAILGTMMLLRFFFVQVIRPIGELTTGIERWERDDFGYRVDVRADDEFGRLSGGFNRAASHLQDLYATLEERVDSKTRSLTEKNRELQILYSISDFLHEPNDIDRLCRGFIRRVIDTLGASAGSVRLLDKGSENLCITVSEGLSEAFIDEEALLKCGDCLCGDASQHTVSYVVDMRAREGLPITRDTCLRAGFAAVAVATISVNRRPAGVFNLYFREARSFGDSDRQLLESLGQQLGTAIDNLRLQARERELAVSEERNLLARELHDSIAQALAFMNLQVQMLEYALTREAIDEIRPGLNMLRQGLQESYADLRELMVHFRARVGHNDLDSAIGAALRRLAEQTGLLTHLDIQGGGVPLDSETETQVLYIVQEALSNIRKHAGAKSVSVVVRRGMDGLTVSVHDDGVGFEDTRPDTRDNEAHIGLDIMRERARRIGGRFSVRSAPGKGTEIGIVLPRQHREAA